MNIDLNEVLGFVTSCAREVKELSKYDEQQETLRENRRDKRHARKMEKLRLRAEIKKAKLNRKYK